MCRRMGWNKKYKNLGQFIDFSSSTEVANNIVEIAFLLKLLFSDIFVLILLSPLIIRQCISKHIGHLKV